MLLKQIPYDLTNMWDLMKKKSDEQNVIRSRNTWNARLADAQRERDAVVIG